MKYRAAATQIKEIPIVFRGNVDPAILATEDISFTNSSWTYDSTAHCYYKNQQCDHMTVSSNAVIFIEFDGVFYGKAERKTTSTPNVYSYGAETIPVPGGSNLDTSEYPVRITAWQSGHASMLTYYLEDDTEHTIRIWLADPVIIGKKVFQSELTGNGQIKRFHCRFALGENGTLHVNPYVILNGNIRVDLCTFASNGDNYLAGDNEEIAFDCYVPIETHAMAYIECENIGNYESILDAAIVVQYEDFIEPESIVGYEGVNLRRR